MFQCRNFVLLTTRLFDVEKFTVLTPSHLLSWYRLSLPIVSLKISSLLNFALNLLIQFSYGTWENDQKPALIPHKICLLNHHFSPHLVHAHSEQWYYISDLSEPYYDTLSLTNYTLLTADTILWCTKNLFSMDFCFLFHRIKYNILLVPCTFCPT